MKKSVRTMLAVTAALFALNLFAADKLVTCTAYGKKTANGTEMLRTDATVTFSVRDYDPRNDETMTIYNVNGIFTIGSYVADDEPLTEKNSYIGYFTFSEMQSNPKYNPRRYKNFVQFRDFDAYQTTGKESGMGGQFLLSKNLNRKIEAKYIFQAGDHMGGTIHFGCKLGAGDDRNESESVTEMEVDMTGKKFKNTTIDVDSLSADAVIFVDEIGYETGTGKEPAVRAMGEDSEDNSRCLSSKVNFIESYADGVYAIHVSYELDWDDGLNQCAFEIEQPNGKRAKVFFSATLD